MWKFKERCNNCNMPYGCTGWGTCVCIPAECHQCANCNHDFELHICVNCKLDGELCQCYRLLNNVNYPELFKCPGNSSNPNVRIINE